MTQTRTRQAQRPAHHRPQDHHLYQDRPSPCSCGQVFPNLGELFGHDCPDDSRTVRTLPNVETTAADSLDSRPRGNGTGRSVGTPATDAQLRYLAKLAADRGETVPAGLSKRQASAEIDRMLKTPAPAAAPAPAVKVRPNKFAAPCVDCKGNVPEGAGSLTRSPAGRWEVRHVGGCPAVVETAPVAPVAPDVKAGHYALPSSGSNDLVFYRVDRPTEGRWAGRTFVKMVVGGKPDSNVPRNAVAGILARIAADPDAGPRYGREIGRCCVCNRTLTDEPSRAAGIGPVCAAL